MQLPAPEGSGVISPTAPGPRHPRSLKRSPALLTPLGLRLRRPNHSRSQGAALGFGSASSPGGGREKTTCSIDLLLGMLSRPSSPSIFLPPGIALRSGCGVSSFHRSWQGKSDFCPCFCTPGSRKEMNSVLSVSHMSLGLYVPPAILFCFSNKFKHSHVPCVLSLVVHSTLMVARRGTKGMMIQAFVRRCGL